MRNTKIQIRNKAALLSILCVSSLLLAGCATSNSAGDYPAGAAVSAADYPAGMGGTRARLCAMWGPASQPCTGK
jgi:hypothetical protein